MTSDEGEVAIVDWAVKPTEEDRKPGINIIIQYNVKMLNL